jgi:hypothetical protein
MILGYIVGGPGNDSFMFADEKHPNAETCDKCGCLINPEYHENTLTLKRNHYDLSHCYDTGDIVSLQFKEFSLRHHYIGLRFLPFDNLKNFCQLFIAIKVRLDPVKRNVSFSKSCGTCGSYHEVIGATPAFFKG